MIHTLQTHRFSLLFILICGLSSVAHGQNSSQLPPTAGRPQIDAFVAAQVAGITAATPTTWSSYRQAMIAAAIYNKGRDTDFLR